jgi:glycine cleavage system regulatory protein
MAIAATVIIAFAIGIVVGNCTIPPGTPDDTMCLAELDKAACDRFQVVLNKLGYDHLTVFAGTAYATVADLKKSTYVVDLKCTDKAGIIYKIVVVVMDGNARIVEEERTQDRRLPV